MVCTLYVYGKEWDTFAIRTLEIIPDMEGRTTYGNTGCGVFKGGIQN